MYCTFYCICYLLDQHPVPVDIVHVHIMCMQGHTHHCVACFVLYTEKQVKFLI